jgi:hypothetical protein
VEALVLTIPLQPTQAVLVVEVALLLAQLQAQQETLEAILQ